MTWRVMLWSLLFDSLVISPVASISRCSNNISLDPFTSARDRLLFQQDDGLSPLLSLASSVRRQFFGTSTDYERLRSTVSQIYNGSSSFNGDIVRATSIYYIPNDTYVLAVFVMTVAILIPLLFFALFFCWKRCARVEVDRDEEEHMYSRSLPQCITWSLGISSITALVALIVFIVLLLIGSERLDRSIANSARFVNSTLPLLDGIHQDILENFDQMLTHDSLVVNRSLFTQFINPLAEEVKVSLNSSLYSNVTRLLTNISTSTNDIQSILSLAEGLLNLSTLLYETAEIDSLINNLTQVVSSCSEFNASTNHTSPLIFACRELLDSHETYFPFLPPTTPQIVINVTQLQNIVDTVRAVIDEIAAPLINDQIIRFNNYLDVMELNISRMVLSHSHSYLDPLVNNSLAIGASFNTLYSQISYGLPDSQDTVELYLGSRYLGNWNEFQFVLTIAFSLALFVLTVGVAVAVGRGLLNITFIYLYGEDNSYVRGSHQVALMLRKFAVWLAVSGLVSGFFFIFVFCLASLVGRTCGNHGNYTEFINDVIDNNLTWNNGYPLGDVYHYNRSFPLLLRSVVSTCGQNVSAVTALQLNNLVQLEPVAVSGDPHYNFIDSMKLVSESISEHSVLAAKVSSSLLLYSTLTWSGLPDLFQPSFVGVADLQQLMEQLSEALDETAPLSLNKSLLSIESTFPSLIDWDASYSTAQDNSSLLSSLLTAASDVSEKVDHVEKQELFIHRKIFTTIREYTRQRAVNVTSGWKEFSSNAEQRLFCDVGTCYPVTELFAQFAVSVCDNLLSSVDLYWISLSAIWGIDIISVILLLLLASRLLDTSMPSQQNSNAFVFSLTDQSFSQIVDTLWLLLAYIVDVWLVVAIARDSAVVCSNANACMWGPGVAFILLSFPVSVSLKIYQWIMLHRLRVYNGVKAQHVQRYWMKKINCTHFYSELILFFLLHIPFLGIAGVYTTNIKSLTVVTFLSLSISLFAMSWFLLQLLLKRKDLLNNISLLQEEINGCCCHWKDKFTPTTPAPDTVVGVANGITRHPQEFDQIEMTEVNPPVLPSHTHMTTLPEEDELEEEDEFGLEHVEEEGMTTDNRAMPDDVLEPYTEEEMTTTSPAPVIDTGKRPSLWLDRKPGEGDNQYIRAEPGPGDYSGVEIAGSCQSDTTSTPRSSIYTSHESIPYHSYSVIPGYTSTDDSSYKDGYDSYDSDPPYSNYIPSGNVRVNV